LTPFANALPEAFLADLSSTSVVLTLQGHLTYLQKEFPF